MFSADLRDVSPQSMLLELASEQSERQNQQAIVGYASALVDGVVENQQVIDESIRAFSKSWSLERMPAVDRAICRVACWEILFSDDVPDAVAIAEAVELAKQYSTEESGQFVNGLLAAIAATKAAK